MVLETRPASSRKSTDIAVIGVGCLFPDAQGLDEFWQRIKQGHDAIGPVPLTHWRPDDYFNADPKKPDHTYAQTGGFLKPYAFDPLKFGIAPTALEATDSTQLLGMVCAHEALVDAGYGPERSFDRDRVSCVIGVTGTLELVIPLGARLGHPIWKAALNKAGVPADQAQKVMDEISAGYVPWQEASFPGLLGNVVAGRIASRLDLGGTNSVVDAACASSLAAVHLAAMELESGRADMVITGGMDTFNDIFMYMCFSKTPALSPTGSARPYDAEGDGTILGEGLGAVILKRLDDAERDGDRIYAVLRSVGSSSDGKGQAIYAPSAKGQSKALHRAYEQAGVSARSIELVEGHGTGTKVGDGVELEALTRVYREVDADAVWCQLGSVKSQIGHTKAAAGAAGLIKAVMALHYKVLPPTIKVKEPHPKLVGSPFILSDKARPWVGQKDSPRRAAVSAFGFGGSNYHAVLEEFQSEKTALDWDPEVQLLAFSADSKAGLLAAVQGASGLLQKGLCARGLGRHLRAQFASDAAERLTFVVRSKAQLEERLAAAEHYLKTADGAAPAWLYHGQGAVPGELAFIYAGQGSQEPGMLRELSCLFPEFLTSLQQANEVLQSVEPDALRLSDRIYPGQAFDETMQKEQRQQLTETRYAQLALGTLGSALTEVLARFGVKPDAVAGHSYGELLALQAAGVVQRADLLRLSYERGRLMKALGKPNGAMLAVMASEEDIRRVLDENGLQLEWANFNADKQVVLGADAELCQKAAAAFKKAGIGSRRLEVSTAFHTSFVEPAADAFLQELIGIGFEKAQARVYANLSGALYPEADEERKLTLSRQLAQPVRFANMLRQMQADGVRTFIEVGPQKKLNGLLKAAVGEGACLSLDAEASSSLLGFGQLLAQLASLGYPVKLEVWDAGAQIPVPAQQKNFTVMISGANYRNPQKTAGVQAAVAKAAPEPAQSLAPAAASARAYGNQTAGSGSAPQTAAFAPSQVYGNQSLASAESRGKPEVVASAASRFNGSSRPETFASTASRVNGSSTSGTAASTASRVNGSGISGTAATIMSSQKHSRPSGVGHESKDRFPQEGTMSSSNDSWQRLEKIMQDMHDIQRKTADAHTLFLENQRQFQSLLHGLMSGESMPAPAPYVAPQAAARPVAPAPQAPARPSVAQATAPAPQAVRSPMPAPTPPVKAPAAPVAAAPAPKVTASVPQPAPKSSPAPQVAGADDKQVYDVLSSCTGYPAELLKADMNLEGDLGIDSIKKVEIFSQLQSHYPHMEADASRLGELQTIGDLLKLTQTQYEKDARVGAWAAGTVALAASSSAQDQQTILEIVAEKTGFPVSMLQPGMELEADLGIDSIKKVEIFSVIQERLPQLNGLAADELNRLRSISDLFEMLGGPAQAEPVDDVSPLTKIMSSGAEELVYQILADKTGYPQEVLTASMSLESDLGIDSIKKVEIFSGLAEMIPGLQSATQDKVGALETVSDLLQLAREGLGDAEQLAEQSLLEPDHRHADWDLSKKKNPVTTSTNETLEPARAGATAAARVITLADALDAEEFEEEAADPLDALHLQRLEAEVFTPDGQARSWLAGTEVWIGDDGSNLARNIMLKLQERGLQARLVSLAQADRLQVPEVLHGLILLAPLKLEMPPVRWLGHAFRLLRRCGPALNAQPDQSLFAVVTRNGGRFGLDGLQTSSQVFGGALSALAKTVKEEWTGMHARALDLGRDFTDGIEAAMRCLDGLLLKGPVELGISRDQLFQLNLHDQFYPQNSAAEQAMAPGDLVLVTGGARGVTAASLIPLAKDFQPKFVIWGRTALGADEPEALHSLNEPAALKRALLQMNPELANPRDLEGAYRQVIQQRELRDTIRGLEDLGAQVVYEAVDVSRDADLRTAFQNLWQNHGHPVGVIHGAGVIRDKWILDQKDEEFFEVLDTKLRVLPYIEECAKKGLRWALLFSSSTARLGRKGQVAYGVANEALNKFAQYLSTQYSACHGLAFNWGPWSGGMVNDGLKKIFAAEGVATIPLEAGAALVHRAIAHPQDSVHELVVLAHGETLGKLEHAPQPLASFTISIESVPVLLDHIIKQRAVVPAALLLEWMAAAAQNLEPQLGILQLRDFKVWKGIVLDADQSLPVWIELVSPVGQLSLEIVLCSRSSQHKKLRHAKVQVHMGARDNQDAIPAAAPLPADTLYQGLNPYPEILFHGDDLHLIESLQSCAPQGVDATLALGHKPAEWARVGLPASWLISGEVVDAVFQAAIIWSTLQQGKPCLPAQVGWLEILQPLQGKCRLQLRVRRADALRLIADADLINEHDEVVMHFRDVEAVLDAGLSQAFRQTKLGSTEPGIGAI
ncbi:MAG TPA: SDR family oxidoreductase [Oligoflexus sp.]|uniref:SDR family oxidoreductase n=1 Tax=Oligoflexus sp. TaxID=1971216 RepID=UPI002D7EB8E7|nr:SDR family oxidoreductase [Oligoflexus sp.]HET9240820.1 SDR family oxidoreductase [Oligoflexus sp.]